MAERLKDIFFTKKFISELSNSIKDIFFEFDQAHFSELVYTNEWEQKELKERMRHLSIALHDTLPKDYKKALKILKKVSVKFTSFDAMVFPDFVELYGINYWDDSIKALEHFTKQCSSEFAIRPFILKDKENAMNQMGIWANSKNEHVRRLASEGCRPRLPWAMALPDFKKDPSLIIPIIEKLKNDESEYVRRSVANNLNDISKDSPELALSIAKKWYGENDRVNWVVKHACRGLLKSGNPAAMKIFGYAEPADLFIENFQIDKETVSIGDSFIFTFNLDVKTKNPSKVRIEYKVYFKKKNGKLSPKVFQITEGNFEPGIHLFSKKHSFQNRTTRMHSAGRHKISIVINGVEKFITEFEVT